jgi:hypothetical protein
MNKLKNYVAAALLGVCAQAFAGPTVSLVTAPAPVAVGSTFDVEVLVSDVVDLYSYQFTLTFNPSLFGATAITEGPFLGTAGATFGDPGTISNADGTISFVFSSLIGPVPGASGSGSLAHITFQALGGGTSALTFSDAIFIDSALEDIDVSLVDGTLQAVPEPASFLLFGAGLAAVGAARRRQLSARG